jgi:hypothetical protein
MKTFLIKNILLTASTILWLYYLYISWEKLNDEKSASLLLISLFGLLIIAYLVKNVVNNRKK